MFEGKRGLKIAIYVKEFSEKEKRLFPDKDQMKICKEFIQSQTKGVLVKEYYDNYTKCGCLPMFNQMIEDGKENRFDMIITHEAERFGKDVVEAYQEAMKLLDNGIGVRFIENDIFTKESLGILKLEIMAQMLEKKKHLQSERVRDGLRRKKRMRNWFIQNNAKLHIGQVAVVSL